jgi:hypothetical protein
MELEKTETQNESIPSRGLGDDVHKVAHALKLDVFANKVAALLGQDDCGCDKRRDVLNRIVPYKIKKN